LLENRSFANFLQLPTCLPEQSPSSFMHYVVHQMFH
jgi:hypothetical protein